MRKLQQGLVSISMILGLSGCIFEDTNTEPVASNITLDSSNGVDDIVIEKSFLLSNVDDDDTSKLSVSALSIVNGFGELTESSSAWTYSPSIKDFSNVNFSYTVTDGEFSDSASIRATIETDSRVQLQTADGITIYSKVDTSRHASVSATLYVNNNEFSVTSASEDGSFAFINVPENSSYLLSLSTESTNFATYYMADNAVRANNEDIVNLEITQLPNAIQSSIKLRSAQNGELVAGLKPYIFANELADPENDIAGLPEIRVFLTEEAEQYSFNLFSADLSTNVYVDSLTDVNNDEYNVVNPQQALPFIAVLSGTQEAEVFLSKVETGSFKVSLQLSADSNVSLPSSPLLAISNLTTNETEYWTLESQGLYTKSLTAEELSQRRALAPIDTNEDGVIDLIANPSSDNGFPMLSSLVISQFDENNELTLTQALNSVDYDQPMTSNLVSLPENFKENGNAEVIIAFDRQIDLPTVIQVSTQVLSQAQVEIDLNSTADIFATDKQTLATTTQGESQLELGFNNVYSYLNENGDTVNLSLGNNGTNQITSPYATEFNASPVSSSLQSANFSLQANDSLLIINLSSSDINAFQSYEFSFTVDAPFDVFGPSSISHEVRAESGSSTLLSDIILDNFDFKNALTLDVTDASSEQYIEGMEPHEDLFSELNVGYVDGGSNDRSQLKYVDYTIGELTSIESLNTGLSLDADANTIYLISKSAIEGSVTVKSQTEMFDNSGTAESSSYEPADLSFDFSSTDNSAGKAFGQLALLLIEPSNHGVDISGIETVFKAPAASGANVNTADLYYVYPLTLTPMTAGRITELQLEFDATVGGVKLNAEQTYKVN